MANTGRFQLYNVIARGPSGCGNSLKEFPINVFLQMLSRNIECFSQNSVTVRFNYLDHTNCE